MQRIEAIEKEVHTQTRTRTRTRTHTNTTTHTHTHAHAHTQTNTHTHTHNTPTTHKHTRTGRPASHEGPAQGSHTERNILTQRSTQTKRCTHADLKEDLRKRTHTHARPGLTPFRDIGRLHAARCGAECDVEVKAGISICVTYAAMWTVTPMR